MAALQNSPPCLTNKMTIFIYWVNLRSSSLKNSVIFKITAETIVENSVFISVFYELNWKKNVRCRIFQFWILHDKFALLLKILCWVISLLPYIPHICLPTYCDFAAKKSFFVSVFTEFGSNQFFGNVGQLVFRWILKLKPKVQFESKIKENFFFLKEKLTWRIFCNWHFSVNKHF